MATVADPFHQFSRASRRYDRVLQYKAMYFGTTYVAATILSVKIFRLSGENIILVIYCVCMGICSIRNYGYRLPGGLGRIFLSPAQPSDTPFEYGKSITIRISVRAWPSGTGFSVRCMCLSTEAKTCFR